MSESARKMKLGLFIRPCGHHIAAWRHPSTQADAGVNFQHFVELAKTAERGLFDMLFSADTNSAFTAEREGLHRQHYVAWIEPFTLLAALAGVTTNIGLVCTASTSFEQPYSVARKFASLDHVSNGRAGWNVVTSGNETEALNFNQDAHAPKAERYKRAREFTNVVRGLWDSWDEDAFTRNRETGIFFDPDKMHVLDHRGDYYKVQGPLNVARTPQGHPVIVQAGASDAGKDLAAETAEVVFGASNTLAQAKEFYGDLKGRMPAFGRDPDSFARAAEATRRVGSPGRRGPVTVGITSPVARSTSAITSRTPKPLPLPRLQIRCSPGCAAVRASTWARAKSATCT